MGLGAGSAASGEFCNLYPHQCLETVFLNWYKRVLRADRPNDIKRGGVCINFEESLPLITRNDLTNTKDYPVTEINVNNEKCFFTCLYRSPSQSHDELNVFVLTLIYFSPDDWEKSNVPIHKKE